MLQRLLHVALNVADLAAAAAFYKTALGFTAAPPVAVDPALARLVGARAGQAVTLTSGRGTIVLTAWDPPGAPYLPGSRSDDLWFQHCAIAVTDMAAAFARLQGHGTTPITSGGPQRLPASTGGVTAYKFRDPEGHPLELIHIPGRTGPDGLDHSALAVADAARSTAFYTGLGLRVAGATVNTGPEQDALDGLDGARVDVVPLLPPHPAPHVELLGYHPPGRAAAARPADIASSRLVFATAAAAPPTLLRDPDGHALLALGPTA